jgi:hypothetical protein
MSTTEATLLIRTKKRTRRDELAILGDNSNADFTYYMNLMVRRLSQDSMSLRGETSGSLASGTNTIPIPSDMVDGTGSIDGITLGNTSQNRNDPKLAAITWEEYLQGAIEGYCLRNKVIYVRPFQETDRTYQLYYRKFHGSSVTTLEFDDKYNECMVPLLCHYVYADLGRNWKQAADAEEVEYKRKLNEVVDDDQMFVVMSRRRS